MFKILFQLFIKTVIKSITSLIGGLYTLKDSAKEKGILFTLSKKTLEACKAVGTAFEKGKVIISGISFIGKLIERIAGISKGSSLLSLLVLVAPAMEAYDKIKKYIADKKAEAILNNELKKDSLNIVRCRRDYRTIRRLASCKLFADGAYLDFSIKSMFITIRRKIAKMIGGVIKGLSSLKIKNKKGRAVVSKIIKGLKAVQKKIDVPEKKPGKFIKILAFTSSALHGLEFLGKNAAMFIPPPGGTIVGMIGNIAGYAKAGVNTVKQGAEIAKDIKEKAQALGSNEQEVKAK